jgi:NCAIR mutase (PurE)-related protein
MDEKRIRDVLQKVHQGKLTADAAFARLKNLPFEDIGFAHVDHHRAMRCGFPEVIFCLGKTDQQVVQIARRIVDSGSSLLATRARGTIYRTLKKHYPAVCFNEAAQAIYLRKEKILRGRGPLLVISAGTSDIPVAEEAAVTAEVMGHQVSRIYDVGVAGIHRLFAHRAQIEAATAIVVVAGMEGALASVVGGMGAKPIIAVPTSVGYGASFKGVAALLGMLTSCTAGVAVVNIDNGFGAGYMAALINRKEET